jgi:lysophospholipase L1-like esterase
MFSCLFFCCDSDKNENNNAYGIITGETFVLNNLMRNQLTKEKISDLKIYSIDSTLNKHFWKENIDYIVENNKISRTSNSNIPNFNDHIVIYNSNNSFTFSATPRNPSLNIPFQIYADYKFYDFEYIKGEYDKAYLSTSLKQKLKNKEQIKIGVIGTSITAGAHTLEQFYHNSDKESYPYLLAKGIEKLYGNNVFITNYSKSGSSIDYLETVFQKVVKDKNDLVLIEFGMNDHLFSSWELELPSFESNISSSIEKLKAQDIDVILVGFFQQNPQWDLEFPNSTITYNQSLYKLGQKYNCYFADVNKEFSKYSQTKINQDLCGDFMHHPTSFGHLLYYKTIIPTFLKKEVTDGFLYSLIN